MFNTIAVLGSGTMGQGIAQLFALHGRRVTLYDIHDKALASARLKAERQIEDVMAAGLADSGAAGRLRENLTTTVDLAEAVRDADLIIEAVPENMAIKRDLFERLGPLLKPEAIVASNTSSFTREALAAVAPGFADRLVLTHFFNPAHLIPLVELVVPNGTEPRVMEALLTLLREAGRSPVVLTKQVPGLIANRLQAAVLREALHLLEEGVASAEDIDKAMTEGPGLRWAMNGPLAISDFGGLDVWEKVADQLFPELDTAPAAPDSLRQLVKEGRLGVKTGHGLYPYVNTEAAIKARDEGLVRMVRAKMAGQASISE